MSLDAVYKAMADPTRRAILARLRGRPMTAGAIAEGFDMTKPSISHHLAKLAEADLIYGEREGTSITYHLNLTVFEDLMSAVVALWKGDPDVPPADTL